jgi:hypothetical protein
MPCFFDVSSNCLCFGVSRSPLRFLLIHSLRSFGVDGADTQAWSLVKKKWCPGISLISNRKGLICQLHGTNGLRQAAADQLVCIRQTNRKSGYHKP